jgi:acid stress chaperone HdeB
MRLTFPAILCCTLNKTNITILTLTFLCLVMPAAKAQVTIDVSKITCQQFRSYTITNPNNIALWLNGYYNGRRNNTVINVETFKENLEKVKDYCITHPTVTVMESVEALLGISK